MTPPQSLRSEAARRILIKDGAYGTQVQERRLQEADYRGGLDLAKDQRGNNDLLNITNPDLVRSICESFAEAGAEILATNTFNANAISQADYGAEALVSDINRAAAEITREVADRFATRRKGRAGSPARSGRPTRPCRFRPTSTTPASARSISTR